MSVSVRLRYFGNTKDVRLLLVLGVPAYGPDHSEIYINAAATQGQVGVMRLLIKSGADVERIKPLGAINRRLYGRIAFNAYPLISAIVGRQPGAASLLLSRGAFADQRARSGATALMIAAAMGDIPCAKALLANGANIDARSPKGKTALMWAVFRHQTAMVRYLICNHAALDSADSTGKTALAIADSRRFADVEEVLRKAEG